MCGTFMPPALSDTNPIPYSICQDFRPSRERRTNTTKVDPQATMLDPQATMLDPQATMLDPQVRECCRHYAYCVPYDRFPSRKIDAVSTIVLSSRVARLPDRYWRGIIVHELGHCVDFYLFGKRYRTLKNIPMQGGDDALEARLHSIDSQIQDPEIRADVFADVLLLEPEHNQLCYDANLSIQTIVSDSEICNGTVDSGVLLKHYTHPPLTGRRWIL